MTPVVFELADPPRTGRLVVCAPEAPDEVTVAVLDGDEVVRRAVPASRLPVAEAVSWLLDGRSTSPAGRFWAAAARFALHLVARGRILPGVSPRGFDAWRVGPLEPSDTGLLRDLATAMPATARAIPLDDLALQGDGLALPGDGLVLPGGGLVLPEAEPLLRAFLDAVADAVPRTPAAAIAAGGPLYAATSSQVTGHLAGWAAEVAAGVDAGVRLSLRIELHDASPDRDAEPDRDVGLAVVPQVHSLADATVVVDAAELWRRSDERFGSRGTIDTVLAVRRAARAWPVLDRLLHTAVPERLELTDDDVADLVAYGAGRLAAAGVDVHWPKHLVRDLTARAVVGRRAGGDSGDVGPAGLEDLFAFDWRLALGDQPLSEAEMDQLAEAHRPVVRLRDRWTLVDPDLLAKARHRSLAPLSAVDALGVALTGTVELAGQRVEVSAEGALRRLRDELIAVPEPVEQPSELKATLRAYQLKGLDWLHRMTSLGFGGCLADDMGLGKTITLIALHLHRNPDAPTLVVCPASLLGNWEREIERFAPGTPVRRFHGSGRDLDGADAGFVLTTYGTMRVDTARLAVHRWDLVVADEAQHVKNPRAGTAKALRAIPARARVALTGTPVENNLSELWSILDWTTPGLLGPLGGFRARWAKPVEQGDAEATRRLSRFVGPFLLRRRKSDPGIAPELPRKTETDQPVALTREQAGLYEATVREALAAIRAATGMERRGLVMKLLTGLKQICNHPAQFLKEPRPRLAGRSGKLELLDELLETIVAEDGAALVFTQYVTMARLIERHLAERGVATLLLYGGTPVPARERMVERFQAGDVPVFLLSLKAAGTGLNLTRADHVIHYDRWWNPAVEDQATDRAYRIGQTRPVQVHRLIAEGTLEDRIAELLAGKRDLAEAVLGGGEAALTELTDAELAALVELRSAP